MNLTQPNEECQKRQEQARACQHRGKALVEGKIHPAKERILGKHVARRLRPVNDRRLVPARAVNQQTSAVLGPGVRKYRLLFEDLAELAEAFFVDDVGSLRDQCFDLPVDQLDGALEPADLKHQAPGDEQRHEQDPDGAEETQERQLDLVPQCDVLHEKSHKPVPSRSTTAIRATEKQESHQMSGRYMMLEGQEIKRKAAGQ